MIFSKDDGEVICVNDDADLVINGGKEGDAFVKPGENTANVPMGKITGGNSDNGAGGIHIKGDATVTLNNVNIVGNKSKHDGGGIEVGKDSTLEKLIELLSTNARKRFGIENGNDFTVWELDCEYTVDPEEFLSMGRATPFEGDTLSARCVLTVHDGKAAYNV